MGFAERMREYRKRLSLTQKELADKMDTTQKTISAWEVERSEPTMGDVIKLCNVFDCTIEDLTGTRQRKIGEIAIDDIYAKLDKLNLVDLITLENTIHQKVEILQEKERIKTEKRSLEKQLAVMQKRLRELEQQNKDLTDL